MSLTRPASVRYILLLLALSVAACAGSVKPPRPEPTPVRAPKAATAANAATARREPPRDVPTGATGASIDTAAVRQPADEPTTVLPSITGRAATRGSLASPATVSSRPRSGGPDQPVRIALASAQLSVRLSATGDWAMFDGTTEHLLGAAHSGDWYAVDWRDGALKVSGMSGD
ncbi:MAG: hypothetical protein ACR2M1_05375, partial [Gemmatimonadaceae bacterium]